jgi:transcriptional regulator with XRE-family HTH domain
MQEQELYELGRLLRVFMSRWGGGKGMSEYELSKRTGLSASEINRILNGRRGVSWRSAMLISRGLELADRQMEEWFYACGYAPPPRITEYLGLRRRGWGGQRSA